MKQLKHYLGITGLALGLLTACRDIPEMGVNKDLSSGLTTRYNGMKPAATVIVMNGEVIHHNDIPLGESFTIVNQQVKGLTARDGHYSAGCSLLIQDASGKTIFSQPDLFAGSEPWEAEGGGNLKCTINTGAPMQWDEEYLATVKFWDKYGSGTLENIFRIRTIDIP